MDELCKVLSNMMDENVTEEYEFDTLDSLDKLEICIAIEEHYDISIINMHTIRSMPELYARIQACS